jgi:hypothetical protein
MDLAQHLATGEWIVRHGAVPFLEPFAWTRQGQPYYAYSWLPEVVFFWLLRALGPLGLHLLEGVIVGGAVLASAWAGRQLRWRAATVLTVALLDLLVLWGVAGRLRPQQLLLLVIPLAWGVAGRIRDHGPRAGNLLALAAVGALAANSHIFFPLTAVPVAFFLLAEGAPRRWLPALGAVVAGWLASPYGLIWPRVFALNFGGNILLQRPPTVAEFRPGFEYWWGNWGVIAVVVVLLAAGWLVAAEARPWRERTVLALFWAVGLLLFAFAGRLVLVWWALAFPLAGAAAELAWRRAAPLLERTYGPLVALCTLGAGAIAFAGAAPPVRPALWRFEGDAVHRMLPRAADDPALWLPSWLVCHARPGATGRVINEFNYGSELNWRLRGFSPSIDGRTIFPDSDAVEFAYVPYGRRHPHATTWRHADLALVRRTFWLAPLLDADSGWVLLAQSGATRSGGALWARRAWWRRWGAPTTVPALGLVPGDARATCAATGVFPKP